MARIEDFHSSDPSSILGGVIGQKSSILSDIKKYTDEEWLNI